MIKLLKLMMRVMNNTTTWALEFGLKRAKMDKTSWPVVMCSSLPGLYVLVAVIMHYDYNGTGVSRQWPIQLVGGNTICLHKQCLAVIRLATLQNIVHKRWAHVHVRTIMLHHDWLGPYKSMRKWCRGAGPSQALLVAYDQATKQSLALCMESWIIERTIFIMISKL